jgi:broad specificity phosphatase PhoE
VNTELIFIRHGTTEGNQNGQLHGRTDVPLGPSGLIEARRAAQRVLQMGNIDLVVSSPLKRAMVTAQKIAALAGVNPIVEPNLREFDFGDLEGLTFDDLQVKHTELYLSLIDPDGFDQSFPNGESRRELHTRVVTALDGIVRQTDTGRAVIVAHLIVIATAIAHLTSGDPNDAVKYLVRNGSITHLSLNRSSTAELITLNDVSHLEE